MKIRMFISVLLIIFIPSFLLFIGCASTGSSIQSETEVEDIADIDELLGLADGAVGDQVEEEGTIAEDDVLRLLGVTEESGSEAVQTNGSGDRQSLDSQIQDLESERTTLQQRETSLSEKLSEQEEILSTRQTDQTTSGGQSWDRAMPSWKESTFSGRYQEALQDYRSHNYRNAIQKFESLLGVNSKHSLSDNCQYWIGESYYGLEQYRQGIVAFEKVFFFTNSNKDDDAQLKLGLCYVRLNDQEKAKREFQKLIDNYPTSEYISIARRFLSQIE